MLKSYLLHHGLALSQWSFQDTLYHLTVSSVPTVLRDKWPNGRDELVSVVEVSPVVLMNLDDSTSFLAGIDQYLFSQAAMFSIQTNFLSF